MSALSFIIMWGFAVIVSCIAAFAVIFLLAFVVEVFKGGRKK